MKKIKITSKNENKKISVKPKSAETSQTNEEEKKQMGYSRLMAKYEMDKRHHKRFRKKSVFIGGAIFLLIIGGFVLYWKFKPTPPNPSIIAQNTPISTPTKTPIPKGEKYGLKLQDFEIQQDILKYDQSLSNLLVKYRVPPKNQEEIMKAAREVQASRLTKGNTLMLLSHQKNPNRPAYLIYENGIEGYTVYALSDSIYAKSVVYDIQNTVETFSGIIQTSLWESILGSGLRYELIAKMEEALAWKIDFYHLKAGDRFKIVYEAKTLDNKIVGVGNLQAVYFKTRSTEQYGYFYQGLTQHGFFDEEARPMKTSYLKAPVKYARISSKFDLDRFHPVLKEVKPHLGTDYAAPEGTPVIAVASGVVSVAAFGENNGNYVKIKHNEKYQTQYLHLQKFAKGIKAGSFVQQGETIGYVGSTGLATGPHVCFRFWKDGQQVDPLKEKLPLPAPLPTGEAKEFFKQRDKLNATLDKF